MKYLLYVDFKARAESKASIKWVELEARGILEAMSEADKLLDVMEDVYLARILEKTGRASTTADKRVTFADFQAILCNRCEGWNINDAAHGEASWIITWAHDNRINEGWAAAF